MSEEQQNMPTEVQTEAKQNSTAPVNNTASYLSLFLALLAIVIAGISFWQYFSTAHELNETTSIARTNSTRLSLIQQQNRHLRAQITALAHYNNSTRISLLEAADWARAASMSQLMNNSENAIKYLQLAAQCVSHISGPTTQNILSAINQDISQLKNSPATNQVDLITQLDSLNQAIMQLPTIFNPKLTAASPSVSDESDDPYATKHWKEKLLNSLSYLKSFIVVHHNSELPILTPQQQDLMRMSISFKVMETQWAVLELQDSLYQNNLNLITELIQNYFIKSPGANDILRQLKVLQQIHLQDNTDALSHSLQAINAELSQLNAVLPAQSNMTHTTDPEDAVAKTRKPTTISPTTPPLHHSVEA